MGRVACKRSRVHREMIIYSVDEGFKRSLGPKSNPEKGILTRARTLSPLTFFGHKDNINLSGASTKLK